MQANQSNEIKNESEHKLVMQVNNEGFETCGNKEERKLKQNDHLDNQANEEVADMISRSFPSIQYDKSLIKSNPPEQQPDDYSSQQNLDSQRKERKGRKERKRRSMPAKGTKIPAQQAKSLHNLLDPPNVNEFNSKAKFNFKSFQKESSKCSERNNNSMQECGRGNNYASQLEFNRNTIQSSQSNLQSMIAEHLIARNS